MDWSIILGSMTSGGLGFVGSLITKGVAIYEARQNHKMEIERMELASRIDLQKADLNLRQTHEEQAGTAFAAAIAADAAATGESKWVRDMRSLWRPSLTIALVLIATIQSFCAGSSTQDYIFLMLSNLATQAVGFWFGIRTFDKVVVTAAARPADAKK